LKQTKLSQIVSPKSSPELLGLAQPFQRFVVAEDNTLVSASDRVKPAPLSFLCKGFTPHDQLDITQTAADYAP